MPPINLAELASDFDLNFDIEEIRTQLAVLGVEGLSGDQLKRLKTELDRIILEEQKQKLTDQSANGSSSAKVDRNNHHRSSSISSVSLSSFTGFTDVKVNSGRQSIADNVQKYSDPILPYVKTQNSNNSVRAFPDDYTSLPGRVSLHSNHSHARSAWQTSSVCPRQLEYEGNASCSVELDGESVETAMGASNSLPKSQSAGQTLTTRDCLPFTLPSVSGGAGDAINRSSAPLCCSHAAGFVSARRSGRSNKISWAEYNHKSFKDKHSPLTTADNGNRYSRTYERHSTGCSSSSSSQGHLLVDGHCQRHPGDRHSFSTKTNNCGNISIRMTGGCGDSSSSKLDLTKPNPSCCLTKLSAYHPLSPPSTTKNHLRKSLRSKLIEGSDSQSCVGGSTKRHPVDFLNDAKSLSHASVDPPSAAPKTPDRRATTSSRSARFATNPIESVHPVKSRPQSAHCGSQRRLKTSVRVQNVSSCVVRRQDPVNRFHSYTRSWLTHLAPGENARQALRWNVKATMMHREVPLLQRNFAEVSRVFGPTAALYLERERQRRIKALELDYVPPMNRRRHNSRCRNIRTAAYPQRDRITFSSTRRSER